MCVLSIGQGLFCILFARHFFLIPPSIVEDDVRQKPVNYTIIAPEQRSILRTILIGNEINRDITILIRPKRASLFGDRRVQSKRDGRKLY